jgi:phosphoribosyl-ATP pyrophosphohydrolase
VCTIGDLKTIIHEAGFNLKFLPHMYHICQNYQIKQYLYTAMTAKVVKDYIF